ncbi:MAG: hypothetical protein ACJ8KF_03725 [Chthoniobacterales bacterium]
MTDAGLLEVWKTPVVNLPVDPPPTFNFVLFHVPLVSIGISTPLPPPYLYDLGNSVC